MWPDAAPEWRGRLVSFETSSCSWIALISSPDTSRHIWNGFLGQGTRLEYSSSQAKCPFGSPSLTPCLGLGPRPSLPYPAHVPETLQHLQGLRKCRSFCPECPFPALSLEFSLPCPPPPSAFPPTWLLPPLYPSLAQRWPGYGLFPTPWLGIVSHWSEVHAAETLSNTLDARRQPVPAPAGGTPGRHLSCRCRVSLGV